MEPHRDGGVHAEFLDQAGCAVGDCEGDAEGDEGRACGGRFLASELLWQGAEVQAE